MSNPNAPSGLTPVKQGGGGSIRNNVFADYGITGGLASSIFRGSAVKPQGGTAGGYGANIDVCAAGDKIIGVFHGCSYVDASGQTQFRPLWTSGQTILAGSVVEALVFDDPDLLFDVQASGAGFQASNVGNTANLVIGAGNQTTGTSADQLDVATLSAASTAQQLQIASLRQGSSYGQYARALVNLFLHYRKGAVQPF